MSTTILLDSGPLGLATNPAGSKQGAACGRWLLDAVIGGATVMVPEIADYEVRRELIRARRTASIARLDALVDQVEYLAIGEALRRQQSVSGQRPTTRPPRRVKPAAAGPG